MKINRDFFYGIALVQAFAGTAGSLFFGEIVGIPPCSLCWYQRIAMYPIVIILAIGLLRKDKNSGYYALPLAIIGLIISIYHNFLYYSIIPEEMQPCFTEVSCTVKTFELFGFLSIPLLALIGFVVITASIIMGIRYKKTFDLRKIFKR